MNKVIFVGFKGGDRPNCPPPGSAPGLKIHLNKILQCFDGLEHWCCLMKLNGRRSRTVEGSGIPVVYLFICLDTMQEKILVMSWLFSK